MTDPIADFSVNSIKPVAGGNVGAPILIFIGVVGLLAFLIWFIIQELSYKHKFKVITITNGVESAFFDRCKISKDENGLEVVKLKKKKLEAPYPPSDAIELTSNGKYTFEARYSPERGFEYIFPENKKHQISTESFTTDQKAFMIYQGEKAERKRKKHIAELIEKAVPYIALIIIVVSLFVFWNDVTEPTLQMADKNLQYQSNQLKILQTIERIESDVQQLKSGDTTTAPD